MIGDESGMLAFVAVDVIDVLATKLLCHPASC